MIKMFLIQLIGAMGFITLDISYHKKRKKDILLIEIISYLLFSIHFYLLNGITGSICNLIGMSALIIIYLMEKYKMHNKYLIVLLFIILILIINTITYQNIYSVFPMIALTVVIISFLFNNENMIRIMGIISALSWLIYAIAYKSYVSIIFNMITFINIIYSLYNSRKIMRLK